MIQRTIFLALLVLWPASLIAQSAYPVPVGSVHPDFELPNSNGQNKIRLSDYRGKKVLLIHFASW